jgi:hypothetical protein
MADPLVLYSVNTLLAYRINEHFYGQIHYVWCSPFFSASGISRLDLQAPPSSTPCDICRTYLDDVLRQDRHSSAIRNNRYGIKSGLAVKKADGMISAEQHRELEETVSKAPLEDFRPLLFVIPFQGVADLVEEIPLSERAHPFSREYRIERLPRSRFDVLDWIWR